MKKDAVVFICLGFFWLLFFGRFFRVQDAKFDFRSYAFDYVSHIKETNKEANISYDDVNVIRDRILPNFWSTVMNPFKWTDEQMSSNDRLLRECKAAWEVKEKERNTEQIIAETTFSEREASWRKVKKKKEL